MSSFRILRALLANTSGVPEASYTTIQVYKSENDALRAELADLKAYGLDSVTSAKGLYQGSTRLVELEQAVAIHAEEKAALEAEIARLESEATSAKETVGEEERRRSQERDRMWEKELAKTIKAKDDQSAKLNAQLQLDRAWFSPVLDDFPADRFSPCSRNGKPRT